MIGFADNMTVGENIICLPTFDNISYIDTAPIFDAARKTIEYQLPELINYISGKRTRARLYGNIKKFYPEEAVYLYNNIMNHNLDNFRNIDTVVDQSSALYPELRVILLNEDLRLENITGYDIISFTKNGKRINTVIISDCGINDKIIFNICLKVFDSVIMGELSKYNIPIVAEKYIPLKYNGTNGTVLCKFIIDYMVELLYPFDAKIRLQKNEIEDIINTIFISNFQILSPELIHDIYDYIHGTINGTYDNYDYIALIVKLKQHLGSAGFFNNNEDDGDFSTV